MGDDMCNSSTYWQMKSVSKKQWVMEVDVKCKKCSAESTSSRFLSPQSRQDSFLRSASGIHHK